MRIEQRQGLLRAEVTCVYRGTRQEPTELEQDGGITWSSRMCNDLGRRAMSSRSKMPKARMPGPQMGEDGCLSD